MKKSGSNEKDSLSMSFKMSKEWKLGQLSKGRIWTFWNNQPDHDQTTKISQWLSCSTVITLVTLDKAMI